MFRGFLGKVNHSKENIILMHVIYRILKCMFKVKR